MSAYLIVKYIDWLCEIMNVSQGVNIYYGDTEQAAKIAMIRCWLLSIASHTNKNAYFPNLNCMPMLLFFSDELDEFSRYAHDTVSDGWKNTECKTEFNCTNNSVQFSYAFKDTIEKDILSFFKGKVNKIMNRFELSNAHTKKITLVCRNSCIHRHVYYYYEKVYGEHRDGYARKSYGKSTNDIQGFLTGDVEL